MSVNGEHDIEGLKRIGAVVAAARDAMAHSCRPGRDHRGARRPSVKSIWTGTAPRSAPQLAYGFPGVTCISVNDELAHGIPSPERVLRAGDLVNIDVSAELDGYWADTGASFPVGTVSAQAGALLRATRLALEDGMSQARAGAPPAQHWPCGRAPGEVLWVPGHSQPLRTWRWTPHP